MATPLSSMVEQSLILFSVNVVLEIWLLKRKEIDMETQTIQIRGDNDAIAYINFVDRDLAVSIVYGDNQYDFTIEPITLKALVYAYKLHCEECDEKYNKV